MMKRSHRAFAGADVRFLPVSSSVPPKNQAAATAIPRHRGREAATVPDACSARDSRASAHRVRAAPEISGSDDMDAVTNITPQVAEEPGARTGRGPAAGARGYPLGYSAAEFRRLEQQAAFLRDLTEDVLRRAGLASGMRVLDIGCGVGDVSLLAAELVGPAGEVLGVDRSPDAIDVASRRAAVRGCRRVRFAAADLDAFATPERFDAVIGRLVLLYLPDPAATLRWLCGLLRPGGIVAMQEYAMLLARSVPECELYCRCSSWIMAAFERAGFERDMGSRLFRTFHDAGLPVPQMISAARAEGGPASPIYDYVAEVVRSLLPVMQRLGVATAGEVGIETLAERLRAEAVANMACVMTPALIGAWTRTTS
jgi:ubiquinone/menaquinone biosynthesis C-methylase UbiE